MDTVDVERLIAKLEAASAGSCELSAEIERDVLGRMVHQWPLYFRATSFDGIENSAVVPVTPYTTSLDCALTLIPEGAVWHVMTDYGDLNRAKVGPRNNPSASIYNDTDRPLFLWADAATPALATCVAALRASLSEASLPETPE